MAALAAVSTGAFLSTPSARRATVSSSLISRTAPYFYPRPPRGGRRSSPRQHSGCCRFLSTPSARRATPPLLAHFGGETISIHALREEGDMHPGRRFRLREIFLSTPSARRATRKGRGVNPLGRSISIHALREEGDQCHPALHRRGAHFYPRPPRGGRQVTT